MIQAAESDEGGRHQETEQKSERTVAGALYAIWKREGLLGFFKGKCSDTDDRAEFCITFDDKGKDHKDNLDLNACTEKVSVCNKVQIKEHSN